MTDAYDDWRETRLRLKAEPDSVYLMRVENSLRPAASIPERMRAALLAEQPDLKRWFR